MDTMGVSIKSAEAERKLRRVKSRPVLSTATEDEILGYNDKGCFD